LRLTETRELPTDREHIQKNEKQGVKDPMKGCIPCAVCHAKAVNPDGFIKKPIDDDSLRIALELDAPVCRTSSVLLPRLVV
jgi:hypothetical protein